jgi:hypothetical protein
LEHQNLSKNDKTNEGNERALEKLKIEYSFKEDTPTEAMAQEAQEVPLGSETAGSKKIKPRALIFKAHDKDLHKIQELIKTQFPEVEIIYVTTGPAASILRVTKSMPFETQDISAQPLYTVE